MTQGRTATTTGVSGGMIDDVRNLGIRISDDLHAWLTALAEREHRSLNGQVLVLLERARAQIEAEQRKQAESGE